MRHHSIRFFIFAAIFMTGMVSGCSSFSTDGGLKQPAALVKERSGASILPAKNDTDLAAIATEVNRLITQAPLSESNAVQIALINNRGLQATYSELGVAEADVVQAGRLNNPGFSFNRTRGGGDTVIDRTLTFNLINLLTAPMASRIEAQRFEEVKLRVADAALNVAAQVRIAYVNAIAAQQQLDYAGQVKSAADSSLELAIRMAKAGNWSQLELQREQLFAADAGEKLTLAGAMQAQSREQLDQLLGLSGATLQFQLPDHLPDVPEQPVELQNLDALAAGERLDIQAGKLATQRVADELGLIKTTRLINVLELGPALNTATGTASAPGYQINIEIPLFDWGQARTAKAEALYMQAAHRLAEQVINAQSQVRSAYADYHFRYDTARRYRDELVPLQKKISAENLLRYNGMLISIFELLTDAREQIATVNASVDALKEFWIADAKLQTALGGAYPTTNSSQEKTGASQ